MVDLEIFEIDENFKLFIKDYKTMIIMRIRLINTNYKVFLDVTTIFIKVITASTERITDPTPSGDSYFKQVYRSESNTRGHTTKLYGLSMFYCGIFHFNECIASFLNKLPFVNKDQQPIKTGDSIFGHYFLNGAIQKNTETLDVLFKHQYFPRQDNSQYPVLNESLFSLTKYTVTSCTYQHQNGLFNMQCVCQKGYYGVDCTHKHSCSNCVENYCMENNKCLKCKKGWKDWKGLACFEIDLKALKICGLNGDYNNQDKNKMCKCHSGMSGKYCTKKIITTTTSINSNISDNTETGQGYKEKDFKSAKVKLVVTASIVSILAVVIITLVIIYAIKKKFQKNIPLTYNIFIPNKM